MVDLATAAVHAGVSVQTVRWWVREGLLEARGGKVRLRDVDRVPDALDRRARARLMARRRTA